MSCGLNHGVRVEFKEFLFLISGSPEILMSQADGMTLSDASLKRGTGHGKPVRSIEFSWRCIGAVKLMSRTDTPEEYIPWQSK